MHINSIKKIKNGYYKVIGEKEYILADDIIIKNNILFKKEIDEDELEKLLKENSKYDILNKVVKYINIKTRSNYEINKYIDKFEIYEEDKKFVIKKLELLNLNNDDIFLKSYVYDHFNLTKDGPKKIKKDLLNHKISIDKIDRELEKISNEEVLKKLEKLLTKKILINHKYSYKELLRKLLIEFSNLGYKEEDIKAIYEKKSIAKDSNLIENEFNKLYNKYVKKYDINKLKLTIKQKLYAKGFEIEDINSIINKKI